MIDWIVHNEKAFTKIRTIAFLVMIFNQLLKEIVSNVLILGVSIHLFHWIYN